MFVIWLKAQPMKSMNWNSATGRMPVSAAPKAAPTIADSAIGVSITRSGPKRSMNPSVTLKRAAVDADVLAETENSGIPFHFFPDALADGFEISELRHGL